VGLSWTGTDDEVARWLATYFDSRASIAALFATRGWSIDALVPGAPSLRDTCLQLLVELRRRGGTTAVEDLLNTANELKPEFGLRFRKRGIPSLGLGSKAPSYLEDLSRRLDADVRGLESFGSDKALDDVTADATEAATDAATDAATGFARDPVVAPLVPLRAGGPLVLSVDLARPAGSATERITVSGLPADWQSMPIVARATAVGATFEAAHAEGVVLVCRNAASISCTLVGAIAGDATAVEVAIAFYDRGRFCGEVRRRFTLDDAALPAAPSATAGVEISGAAIEPGIAAPDLTVVVRNLDAARPGLLHWDLRLAERHQTAAIRDLPRELSGKIDLEGDPRRWALDLFDEFATAGDGADLSLLESIGEKLWQATPECFRQTYWALRAAAGEHFSIQFVCGDPFVPWEFLRPIRGDEALPILMQNHPVARWMPAHAGAPRGALGRGRIVTIASPRPSSPPLPELKAAKAQSDLLRERFDAAPCRATKQDVMALLASTPDEPVAILHFAGHGAIDANLDKARIFLDDGPLQSLLVDSSRVTLGRGGRTLVFLNACSVGQDGRTIGTPAGWPAAFLNRAFRGFLAPISKVWELDAARFAQRFVALTWRDGLPIGEALRQLRAEADSATPFAYIYYGDVMARFA
jgi:hypothetical protein